MQFDHAKLVARDLAEVSRFRRFLLGLQAGEVTHAAIVHEEHNECCQIEPWGTTERQLIAAMLPDMKTAFVKMEAP
jgi:hypothetical protein